MEELDTDPTQEELCKAIDRLAYGKALATMASHQTWLSVAKTSFFSHFWTSSANVGEREPYHKTCEMPRLSHCTRTRVTEVTATTTEAFPSWASSANYMPASCSCACRSWQSASTPSPKVASVQNAQLWTWYSPSANCRRNAENSKSPCMSPSSTWLKHSTWSAGKGSSTSCWYRMSPKLHKLIISFHDEMRVTVQYEGSIFEPFVNKSGVKQGCVLTPTLFSIFFSMVQKHALGNSTEGMYLHTRSDGRLFNLARVRPETKTRGDLIRDLLFPDDAAVTSNTEQDLQCLMDRISQAFQDFGLTISLKKTNVMGQDVDTPSIVTIDNYKLHVVHQFIYLGSTISETLSHDA